MSHPELAKSIELTTRSSEARNGIKDLREKGILEVKYCPSKEMIADNLTKPKVGLEGYGKENEKVCWSKAFS
ncbi:hypothetical protein T07_10505 [Trichinella nelsoni]|uniref:Uncharacterized protein n=1 Tax=Trichinella nelsoni TaxID=6336 RepID=A0A0V0RHV6_9BILA|nr:hypothetical protein T07_10505 [Trichinella nelsoni]